ncbi:MAG: hypothetical protein LBK82_12935 [Planctomycetaceae bacterium]|nr:hypothetical protein [Planctomycetaceae bacterium]
MLKTYFKTAPFCGKESESEPVPVNGAVNKISWLKSLSCRKVLPKTWSLFLAEPSSQPFPFLSNTCKTLRPLMLGFPSHLFLI